MSAELVTCPRCGTYTTAPTHCGTDVTAAAVCTCGHRALNHHYVRATRRNGGRCVAGCGCLAYVEAGVMSHA